MKKLMLYGLGLVLAAPLCAQGALYSPKALASTEGQYYAYYFFRYAAGRWQEADGENRGKVAVITHINTRRDGTYTYNTSYGMGRTWSNLKLMASECDLAKFSSTFSNNPTTTPTTVYNASYSIPSVSGKQTGTNLNWGGPKGSLKIPFSQTWLYTGKGDILTDWTYSGGKLNNNATWSGSRSRYYMIDSYGNTFSPTGSASYTHKNYFPSTRLNNNSTGVTGRCNDSAHTRTTGSYMYVYAYTYGQYYSNRGWAEKLRFYSVSYYTAFDAPVLHAYSLKNNPTGVDIGTGCNKLHVAAPLAIQALVTAPQSLNSSAYSGYRYLFAKWMKSFGGVSVTGQAAWADSKTKNLNLSQAREIALPNPMPAPKRLATYHYTNTNTTGFGPYDRYVYNPAFKYDTK